MIDPPQPGLHLEADDINAFVEGALPEHDRLATLTHLADCAHCRQVVFLTRQSQELEYPAPAAKPTAPFWKSWFTSTPLLGAATAALVCVVVVTVVLHRRPATVENRQDLSAKLEPNPQNQIAPPAAAPIPSVTRTPASTLKPAAMAPRLAPPPPPVRAPEPLLNGMADTNADSKPASTAGQSINNNATGIPQGNLSFAKRAKAGGPAYSQQQQMQNYQLQRNGAVSTATQAPPAQGSASIDGSVFTSSAPMAVPPPPVPSVSETVQVNAINSKVTTTSEASTQTIASDRRASVAALAGRATARPWSPLPSKLPIASSVFSANRTLAVDTAGTLFLSLDSGAHWLPVAPQWTGRVIHLELAKPAAENKTEVEKVADATTTVSIPATPPGISAGMNFPVRDFQLTTGSGVVWLSSDGLSWHRR